MRKILAALLLAALSFTASAEVHLAQYGVQYVAPFKLYSADGTLDVDELDGGTEVSVRCQGGTNTTATNDFADKGSDYEIVLTAAEMQCATVIVTVAATTTEVFSINTVNNASAAIPQLNANVTQFGGSAGTFASGIPAVNAVQISDDGPAADELEVALDLRGGGNGAIPWLGIHASGTAQAYTAATPSITLAASTDAADDAFNCTSIAVRGSTEDDWVTGTISGYAGATDIATLAATLPYSPTGTLSYVVWGVACASGSDGNILTVEGADATTYFESLDNPTLARLPAALVSGRMDASVGAYQTGLTPLQPTVPLRTLDVSAGGEAGLDLANVGSPTTTLALSGTTISTAQVAASVTGNVGGNVIGFVGSVNTNGISAASIAPDAGTEIATAAWAATTRELTSGLNIVLAKGTGVTGFNDLSAAQVNAEADTALSDIYLNQLLAVAYDPASPPGAADSLLEDLIENASGTARFTTGALVNAPAGGGGGSSDWSVGEREQLRHRFGIDGDASAPSATPSLASAAQIAALNDPSIAEIRDMIIEDVGGGVSQGCAQAVLLTFAAGDISTSGGTTTWRDPSNGEVRIVSTVTSSGNRTSTITCPTY